MLNKLINFLFPNVCALCKTDIAEGSLCPKCLQKLKKIEGLTCVKCGVPLPDGGAHCHVCKKTHYAFDKLVSAFEYSGGIKNLLYKFKYSGRHFLSKDLALQTHNAIKNNPTYKNADYIIPVPLHLLRRIKRGYNQAELLSQELSVLMNIPVLSNALKRTKRTKAQFSLGKAERAKNMESSFRLKPKYSTLLKGKTLLLVDDIATTCATLNECTKALKQSKPKTILAVTVARDVL
jgi:ComF family protein